MIFYLTFLILIVPNYGSNICCAPDQYEATEGLMTGSVSDEVHSAATYGQIGFAYDAKNKMVFEDLHLTVTNISRNYKILSHYKQNVQYMIEGNVCKKSVPRRPWRPSCIPSNATVLPNYYIGPQNQSLSMQEYIFQEDTKTVIIGVTGDHCIPVIYKSYGESNGQNVMTFTGFQNLTIGIKDPHIFDVPDICQYAENATNTFRGTRRSLFSMIYRY